MHYRLGVAQLPMWHNPSVKFSQQPCSTGKQIAFFPTVKINGIHINIIRILWRKLKKITGAMQLIIIQYDLEMSDKYLPTQAIPDNLCTSVFQIQFNFKLLKLDIIFLLQWMKQTTIMTSKIWIIQWSKCMKIFFFLSSLWPIWSCWIHPSIFIFLCLSSL